MPNLPVFNAPDQPLRVGNEAEEAWRYAGRTIGALGRESAEDTKQGFETAARGLEQAGQNWEQQQNYSDKISGLKTYTQNLLDYKNKVDHINQTMTGDAQHAALTQAFSDYSGTMNTWADQFHGSSKEVQLWAQDESSRAMLQARSSFVADNAITAANNSVIDIGRIANNIAGGMGKNPTINDIDHGVATWDSTIAAAGQSVFTTDPEKNAKIKTDLESHREQIVQTAIASAITNDPTHGKQIADQMIPYYAAKGMLTPEQQRALRAEGDSADRLSYYQGRAQQEDQLQKQRLDAQSALKTLTDSTFSLGPDGKVSGNRYVPPDYFSKLLEISKLPGSNDAEVKAASNDAQEILNRQKNGVIATTDATTYHQLFTKSYAGLTDQDVFTAHAQGKLSDHDSTMFHQAVEDAAKNPQLAQAKQQFTRFIDTYAKGLIAKSNMMNPSAWEGQRLQQFENDKWVQLRDGLTKGLTVDQMLDQRNPNFIGKDIKQYMLTPEQQVKSVTEQTSPAGLSPLPPVDSHPARLPGEKDVDYLKRIRGF